MSGIAAAIASAVGAKAGAKGAKKSRKKPSFKSVISGMTAARKAKSAKSKDTKSSKVYDPAPKGTIPKGTGTRVEGLHKPRRRKSGAKQRRTPNTAESKARASGSARSKYAKLRKSLASRATSSSGGLGSFGKGKSQRKKLAARVAKKRHSLTRRA